MAKRKDKDEDHSFTAWLGFIAILVLFALVIGGKYKEPQSLVRPEFKIEAQEKKEVFTEGLEDSFFPKKVEVSWYDAIYDGFNCDDPDCITASGEPYNTNHFTCACAPWYELGTKFILTYNERTIIVRCNDRGAFWKEKYGSRELDLSKSAFQSLAPLSKGKLLVALEVLNEKH